MGNFSYTSDLDVAKSEIVTELNKHREDVTAFITALSGHVHGGTDGVGAAASAAGPAASTLTSSYITNSDSLSVREKWDLLIAQMNLLKADIGTYRTAQTAHQHGGVTTGTSDSGAMATVANGTVALSGSFSNMSADEFLDAMIVQYNSIRLALVTLNAATAAHTHLVNTGVATADAIAALAAQTSAVVTSV